MCSLGIGDQRNHNVNQVIESIRFNIKQTDTIQLRRHGHGSDPKRGQDQAITKDPNRKIPVMVKLFDLTGLSSEARSFMS